MIKAGDFTEWLDSKPPFSVVYISFGSVVNLKQEQATEIAYGLMSSDRSCGSLGHLMKKFPRSHLFYLMIFWWRLVIKVKVVQWSQQQWVLAHPSVACFMTRCRWNSVLEVLANGVPVLAFPQWGDQFTNAKCLVDEFKVGIQMDRGEAGSRIILPGKNYQMFARGNKWS